MALKSAGNIKRVLRPERLRQVPVQFSWVDQALLQRHLIDRFEARSAALYLFLVTVADAAGAELLRPPRASGATPCLIAFSISPSSVRQGTA